MISNLFAGLHYFISNGTGKKLSFDITDNVVQKSINSIIGNLQSERSYNALKMKIKSVL
jgi:hypothetical protein